MGHIFRMDTPAAVTDKDLKYGSGFPPFNPDTVSLFCVVHGVFYKIADGFRQPALIAEEHDLLISGKGKFLSLLLCLAGKMSFDVIHHFGNIFHLLFKNNRSGIQLGDLQKILDQVLDPVQFLFGKCSKFFDLRYIFRFLLQQTIINIQGRKGCL